ncbi:sialate O-acetylesterase [Sunxiuqinia sp. A32]|uniref:sialate O-acetylesterase n=1 Tax=Sunxiuqinia sp. A32 TaxID=3461496 RepID=UPI004046196D
MKKITLFIITFFLITVSFAEVKTARIFGSNMVLQKGLDNPIWGWADKGEKITVRFNNQEFKTKADKQGKWKVRLQKMEYGGPYVLTIEGKSNTITYDNILIGEVWVCSGQSNMEWIVENVNNKEQEIAEANYPKLRMFTVPKKVSQVPIEDMDAGEWELCSPKNVGHFSAVGYFFARKLLKDLNVPIGMIHTSWGGTVAETWISPENIEKDEDLSSALAELNQLDLENYKEQKLAKIKNLFDGDIPTNDTGLVNGKAVYASMDLDENDWKSIETPALWESEGFPDIDGIAWYRKKVNLTAEQASSRSTIHLSKIDDNDQTWINGQLVGATNDHTLERIYPVESGILKEGENIIAVRVQDTGGGGGIYGNKNDCYLSIGDEKISLAGEWKFKFTYVSPANTEVGPNDYPTLLYNGMIKPILGYGIKGAIWYQGESNADRAYQYRRVFQTLIKDWRQHWGVGDFPFFWVQLANFMQAQKQPEESAWAELREAQTMALELPNTGQALAIDIGNANDIHPRNKQDVGKRLALNALKVAYGKDFVNSGPMYESMEVDGNKVIVHFKSTGSGLEVKDKYGYLKAFAIAGADKKFYWAKGIQLDENSIILYSEKVETPVAVRFGWADNPDDLNLYNKEGLPAVPFRTDTWKGITEK